VTRVTDTLNEIVRAETSLAKAAANQRAVRGLPDAGTSQPYEASFVLTLATVMAVLRRPTDLES
jgi:hypothetical protein